VRIKRVGIIAIVAALVTLSSAAVTYALLNTVALTDIVSITHKTPSPRTAVEDTIELDDEAGDNSKQVEDELLPADSSGLATYVKDDLSPSESALAVASSYYLVSVTSTFGILDKTSSGESVSDYVTFDEKLGNYANAGIDAVSMLDSIARLFFIAVADSFMITDSTDADMEITNEDGDGDGEEEVEDEADGGGGGGGPSNLVFDESYFSENPLKRFQVRSFGLTDSKGSAFSEVKQGEVITITAAFRNYQKFNQSYTVIVQIEDVEAGYTKEILYSSGWSDRAKTSSITISWVPEKVGTCKLKLMIWTGLDDSPIPLTDSISKSLKVASSRTISGGGSAGPS